MNKKQYVFCLAALFMLAIFSSNALAAYNATEETEFVNKGYTWLSDSVRGEWPVGTEDTAFSLLALAYDDMLASQGKTALEERSKDLECWPKTSCNVKETSLAVMALSRIGQDTSRAEEWLMAKNSTPSELNWFLQIDSVEKTTCTVYYNQDSLSYNITLDTNKKINKAVGSCLSLSYGNYWLRISKDCYEKKFSISCDREFVTTLFYQKPGTPTIYISSDTKRMSAGGEATLKISSICLKSQDSCDYEGTAWAAFALSKNRDASVFIPYLVGYSEANKNIMPEAFLLLLTGQDDYANALISQFKREGYWSSGSRNSYFDTALALFALRDRAPKQKDIAKNWLLKEQVKTGPDIGSWQNSKKDTGFVLYSVWPKDATYVATEKVYCADYGYFCLPTYDCNFDARLPDYYCSGSDVCCREKQEEKLQSCSEMSGNVCDYNAICSGTSKNSLNGLCCIGTCEEPQELSECKKAGNTCRYPKLSVGKEKTKCEEGEKENNLECEGARICCQAESAKKGSKLLLWILLGIIIAGIIAFFLASKKFKFKPRQKGTGTLSPARPPPRFPPSPSAQQARPFARTFGRSQPRELSSNKDLEETLRKLRERGL